MILLLSDIFHVHSSTLWLSSKLGKTKLEVSMSGYEIVQSWKSDEYPLIASADRPEILENPAGEIELADNRQEHFNPTHSCPTIGGAFTCDGHYTCIAQ